MKWIVGTLGLAGFALLAFGWMVARDEKTPDAEMAGAIFGTLGAMLLAADLFLIFLWGVWTLFTL